MRILRSGLALVVALLVTSGAGRAATWEGDLLNVQVYTPTAQDVAFNGNFIAPTGNINLFQTPLILFEISASGIKLTNNTNAELEFQPPLLLVKITDTTAARILNAQVAPDSTVPLGIGALISGNNFVQFDLAGLTIPGFGFLSLEVAFLPEGPVAVPAPASLALLAMGLVGLALVRPTKPPGVPHKDRSRPARGPGRAGECFALCLGQQ